MSVRKPNETKTRPIKVPRPQAILRDAEVAKKVNAVEDAEDNGRASGLDAGARPGPDSRAGGFMKRVCVPNAKEACEFCKELANLDMVICDHPDMHREFSRYELTVTAAPDWCQLDSED